MRAGKSNYFISYNKLGPFTKLATSYIASRWREIRACNDNACGESKSQNSHENLLGLTFLIAATDPKASIY
jgi:hypothetical protein